MLTVEVMPEDENNYDNIITNFFWAINVYNKQKIRNRTRHDKLLQNSMLLYILDLNTYELCCILFYCNLQIATINLTKQNDLFEKMRRRSKRIWLSDFQNGRLFEQQWTRGNIQLYMFSFSSWKKYNCLALWKYWTGRNWQNTFSHLTRFYKLLFFKLISFFYPPSLKMHNCFTEFSTQHIQEYYIEYSYQCSWVKLNKKQPY
jgi:hypothetical protein